MTALRQGGDGAETDGLWLLIAAAIGAAASFLITGYSFGIGNNYFHLPILERLYDEPQFRNDAFIQSLRYFAAGPFLLLGGSAKYISPELLFQILDYVSRLLSFIGLLLCARQLGVSSRRARMVFVLLASFTQLLRGYSFAGGGGLFIEIFTHSELANGLLLISLYYATNGRLTWAFLFNGLVFFTNAFMAVWNAVPLGIIIVLLWRDGRIAVPQIVRRGALGLVAFAICAAPILWNILSNPEFGQPIDFNYVDFLKEYWPFHFIFGPNLLSEKIELGVVVVTGVVAFIAIGRAGRLLHAALWGFVIVYGVGIVMPSITASPLVLNLHLLRSSAALHIMTALASVSLATTSLLGADVRRARVFGPLLALSLCTFRLFTFAAPVLIVLALVPGIASRIPAILLRKRNLAFPVTASLLAIIWAYQTTRTTKAIAATTATSQVWRALGQWAYTATDPAAMFMLPISERSPNGLSDKIEQGKEIFQFISHRRVWIDVQSGAAVMWSPSYYAEWHRRVRQQLALSSVTSKVDFAKANGIDYVVDHCHTDTLSAVFSVGDICVYSSSTAAKG